MSYSDSPSSLRARILAIALVPSMIFVLAGLGTGWYLSRNAIAGQTQAGLVVRKVDVVERFVTAVLNERRAGVLGGSGQVATARQQVDEAASEIRSLADEATAGQPVAFARSFEQLRGAADGVPRARQLVQGGVTGFAAYDAYEQAIEPATPALAGVSDGSDADVVAALAAAGAMLTAAEAADSAGLIATSAAGKSLDADQYREFTVHAGGLHGRLDAATDLLRGASRDQALAVVSTPQWRRFSADAATLIAAGPATTPPAPNARSTSGGNGDAGATSPATVPADFAVAGTAVASSAAAVAFATARDAAAMQAGRAQSGLTAIVVTVLSVVALAVLAMIMAFRVGMVLVRRLMRLRDDTLHTAAVLPAVLDRLREGEEVEVYTEIPTFEHGDDEIGQVAAAVNTAQRAAATAAAEEARTRAGANAVFLNIAHRSQAIVHRQLQLLDEAERAEDNSDQLARLYQLDHLTTRERRNAENLIIMGGQQPRRRWRQPVSMIEIVRSAVSESEQYTRITLGDVPDAFVEGAAVGDLIHLLAELVDNATSFSPPQCPIDIQAHTVGRGVVVEVQDRGLGIDPEPRERLNAMLAAPPDFGLMTLSEDSRLGTFVVARLADRHGVRVTLMDSPYGGVQALVLVPNAVLVEAPVTGTARPEGGTNVPASPRPRPNGVVETAAVRTGDGTGAARGVATASNGGAPAPAPAPAEVEPAAAVAPAPRPDESVPGLPMLPERQPQVNLARELHDEPAAVEDVAAEDVLDEPPARRSGAAMSALQKGSREGRGGPAPGRNGHRS